MFKFLKKLFNIHPDSNQKWLLCPCGISMLIFTYTSPIITKTIISSLPSEWLAFEAMVISLFGLVIGMIWQGKIREKAVKFFMIIAITESICGLLLGLYLCFVDFNVWLCAIGT